MQALDWMHTSSITVGPDGSYYAALRNVNTILCLGRDGEGLKWSLSPTLRSNFTFASAADHFYNPHVPILRDATHLLLMDDGNNRPNCTNEVETCYSRAVELALDFARGTAREPGVPARRFGFDERTGQTALDGELNEVAAGLPRG